MKQFLQSKLGIFALRMLQALIFAIPFMIFILIYKDEFFSVETKMGISGLLILGGIIWALALAKVIGKMPKFLWFIIIAVLFVLMDYLAGFLKQIGYVIVIGAVLALPLNLVIEAKQITGKTQLEEESKKKYYKELQKKAKKDNKKKVDVVIEG